jgi:hypothetical protein
LIGVGDHPPGQRTPEIAARLHALRQVGHHRRIRLDLCEFGEPRCRQSRLQRFGFRGANRLQDVVVAGLAEAFLGAEVMKDQYLADGRGVGDGLQSGFKPVPAELLDRDVADPRVRVQGSRRQSVPACVSSVGVTASATAIVPC